MCLSSFVLFVFVFNDTATTEIYTSDTLFPYTTLFRAPRRAAAEPDPALRGVPAAPAVLDADHARRRRRPGGAHRPRRPRARALGRYRVACRLRADGRRRAGAQRDRRDARWLAGEAFSRGAGHADQRRARSEERRVGKEWVSTCRSRLSPHN